MNTQYTRTKWALVTVGMFAANIATGAGTEPPEKKTGAPASLELEVQTVTAQKREEAAKDIPISLEVFSRADIANKRVQRTEDAFNQTANANMGSASGGLYDTYASIRGVGSSIIDTDPSVGLFIDGTPVTDPQAYSLKLLDMERVELLRGPQGTLYGRNTLAGSVNLITHKPDHDTQSAQVGLETGSYGKSHAQVIANTPLGDGNWALRVAGAGDTSDGMTRNVAPGEGRSNRLSGGQARISLEGFINDSLQMLTIYEHGQQNTRDSAYLYDSEYRDHNNHIDSSNPFRGTLINDSLRNQLTWFLEDGASVVAVTSLSKNKVDYTGSFFPNGYFNELNADFEAAGLMGYQNRVNNPYSSTFKQASQEIRYVSAPDAPIKWLAGVYGEYSDSKRAYTATSTFSPLLGMGDGVTQTSSGQTKTTSFAVFSDASFAATDALEIFGGLRVGHDKKKFDYDFTVDNPAWSALGMDANFVKNQRDTLTATYVVPRIGVRYQVTDATQTYASVSRGFKSGGFNIGFVQKGDERPYKDESLVSYEIGLKSDLIKNVLSLDTALFYIDRKNQQVQTYNALTQSTPVANAPKSRSFGGEMTLKAQLDDHWSGYAGVGYTDATYVKFNNAPATGTVGLVDASGKQQQFVSKYTGNLGAAYAWDIGAYNLKGRGDLGYQYRSSFYFDQSNTQKQAGYGLVNARLSVSNSEYEGYVWGENLSNERYRTSAADFGYGRLVTMGNPRTFGVGISKTF